MKKMKKVLAMLLALAMVMGMSMTSFAEEDTTTEELENAVIYVNGLNANANTTVNIYQVVSLSSDGNSWIIAEDASEYVNTENNPYQFVWTELEKIARGEVEGKSLELVKSKTAGVGVTNVTFDDLAEGAYLILATDDLDADENAVDYSPMGETTYNYDTDSNLIIRETVAKTVYAKYDNYIVTKKLTSGDNFVSRGEEVTFDITATFPSFAANVTNRAFSVTDTPSGLQITNVIVKVGGTEVKLDDDYTLDKVLPTEEALTVNFNSDFIGQENEYAGKTVVVTVTAIVTSDSGYTNTANASNATSGYEVKGYTGKALITKIDNKNNVLTGAEFTLAKEVTSAVLDEETGEVVTPATYEDVYVVGEKGVYKVALDSETGATTKLEATDGTIVITGLDEGVYKLTETLAPAGYKVLEDIPTFEIKADYTTNVVVDDVKVVNTKLSALPSTGGIGTAVFTIGGCAIMIAAAYFFLASRKKES